MKLLKPLSGLSFAIYGLGLSGNSVLKYLRKNKVKEKNIYCWDDELKKKKFNKKKFNKSLDFVNYIVVSPGVDIKKSIFKTKLQHNKNKIITDLDLFFMQKLNVKSIVVTGTNGKSTTCKLLEHILKVNKFSVKLGGNIGKPILDLPIKKNSFVVIEASSFQLAYSKYIKPNYAAILNITKDHLDWHRSLKNYILSKFNIFKLQKASDKAFLSEKKLINIFFKKKFKSRLIKLNKISKNKILINKINNTYLTTRPNIENLNFAYNISKYLKISKNNFIKAINSFKGLPHRHELVYEGKNLTIINDSKATSFDAAKFALEKNKNIYWIVGGLPKLGDTFSLGQIKKNINKAYIIGKSLNYFRDQLKGKVIFEKVYTLKKAVIKILQDLKYSDLKPTILLSPASASYDQFNNFVHRGNAFKKLIKSYGRKFNS
jgi:UDP-N-acetylmuramoylalanine--D-glutamate ligase